jgi:phytol kinase
MVTMVEAVATRGIDNLIIPIAGWYLVSRYMAMDLPMLVERFIVVVALMTFVLLLRKRSSLDGSSLLGVVLFAYGCWSLGGWPFLLIPFLFYVSHLVSTHAVRKASSPTHDLYAVLSCALTGLIWLVLTEMNSDEPFKYLFPFVLGIGAHFGIRNFTTLRFLHPKMQRSHLILRSSVKAVLFCYLPLVLCKPLGGVAKHAALGYLVCVLATSLFSQIYRRDTHRLAPLAQ